MSIFFVLTICAAVWKQFVGSRVPAVEQSIVVLGNVGQYNAVLFSTVHCSAAHCISVQCNAVQYNIALKCSTEQYSDVQCSTLRYSALHCRAILCKTIRFRDDVCYYWASPNMQCSVLHIAKGALFGDVAWGIKIRATFFTS